jgi:MoaA/NifB/PqqE/SkfB family radical SAM enzyme
MRYIDLHISYSCYNKCIFCSQAGPIDQCSSHPLAYKDVEGVLEKNRRRYQAVNLTGGEPTLFPEFEKLVKRTKGFGYRICVGSGGGRFSDKKFCEKAAPYIDEVCFSCHGHTGRLHDLHTSNKGSFNRLKKAMENLAGHRVTVSANTVITRHNLPFLDRIIDMLAGRGVKMSLFFNLYPEGRALGKYGELVAALSGIKKKIPALSRLARRRGMFVGFYDIPDCILGGHQDNPMDTEGSRLSVRQVYSGGSFYFKGEEPYSFDSSKIKTKKCGPCHLKNVCCGIFSEYYRLFGDKEIKTIGSA